MVKSDTASALQVILPVIYILIGLLSIIANLNGIQIICSNRFRHKSIHLLVLSLCIEDLLFSIIFMIIRAVSYAHLSSNWFIDPQNWCKAEMYLLRLFEFILAYTIVAMCLTRIFKYNSFCCSLRSLRTGFAIVASIWVASAYILIPILLFKQNIVDQQYGGYLCTTTDTSVLLSWLSATPRATLDIIDIIFRIIFPSFLMIVILVINFFWKRRKSDISVTQTKHLKVIETTTKANYTRLVITYACVFLVCQLPYEIYRFVMIQNDNLRVDLKSNNLEFAVEIPLLLLKLINRVINPFLYVCLADKENFSHKFCRLWCFSNECWFKDCGEAIRNEFRFCVGSDNNNSANQNLYSTGIKSTTTESYFEGNTRVTKKIIVEEFEETPGISSYKNDAFVN